MDVLALYQPRNNAPLDDVARLAGLPGKIGLEGSAVWERYLAGERDQIRAYCEADCANTYLLWLRFQRMRGSYTAEQYERERGLLRAWIEKQDSPTWREFLARW
jgi:predicted PolB exonuclease-like 3'-5' exonuclease